MLATPALMRLPFLSSAAEDPDAPLVQRIQRGDQSAFEELYARYRYPMARLVSNIVREPESVPDLVQEIFTRVYFAMNTLTPGLPFRPWLYRVATNHCVDFLRKRKRQPNWVSTTGEDGEENEWLLPASGGSVLQQLVSRDLAHKLLAELKPRDRMLLVMKEIQELSLEEIGQATGMGESAVKVALFRARKRMLDHYRKVVRAEKKS